MKIKFQSPMIFFLILSLLILSCGPVSVVILTPSNPDTTPVAPGTASTDATAEPELSDIISADNAQNLVEIATWGKGSGHLPTYSPDGTLLAVSSSSSIYVYDSQTLVENMRIEAIDTYYVLDIAFSPDGKTLSAFMDTSLEQIVKQWDLASGSELHSWIVDTYNDDYSISTGVISPDGKTLAIVYDYHSSDGGEITVKLWDATSGQELQGWSVRFPFPADLAFSPDGKTLAVSTADGTVTLYDVSSGSQLHTLSGHGAADFGHSTSEVYSLAFSADGRTLAVGFGADTSSAHEFGPYTTLWDVASGSELRTLSEDTSEVLLVAFSPDGKTLAGGFGGAIKLRETASGNELLTINVSNLESLTFSPDGKTLVSASSVGDDSVKLWDTATGELLNTLKGENVFRLAIFSSDSSTLAYASTDNTIRLRDAISGEVRILGGHPDWVMSLAFSLDGSTLASGSFSSFSSPGNNVLKLWDVASGSELRTLTGHSDTVASVALSADGKMLASGSWDETIKLWDVASGNELRTLTGNIGRAYGVAFSPDGKTLASAFNDDKSDTVKLWDVASGGELQTLSANTNLRLSVAFSPDGKVLVSSNYFGYGFKHLWDVASGQELHTISGGTDTQRGLAFSPDGKTLATGFEDGTVKLWDIASGQELYSLSGHTKAVYGLAFSPDGRILATGGDNIKLWDVASNQELASLSLSDVNSLVFSPDGELILAHSPRGMSLWGVSP